MHHGWWQEEFGLVMRYSCSPVKRCCMMETHCNKIDLSEALQKDVSQWSMRFASNFQKSAGASNAPFFRIESSCL
jgi:hypothetical protein